MGIKEAGFALRPVILYDIQGLSASKVGFA